MSMLIADTFVRQILGNTGQVSHRDYTKATRFALENVEKGLYPTTGGAVSLMHKEVVEELYKRNAQTSPSFTPRVPDRGGKPASSLEEWYVAAVEQALLQQGSGLLSKKRRAFDPNLVSAMDGFLHTYSRNGLEWRRIFAYAQRLDSSVPPFGRSPFWLTFEEEPMSVLAFCGERVRAGAPRSYMQRLADVKRESDEFRQGGT
ncbi:MAG: hypothetical protein U0R23_09780 [Candidatus Nanopelagicales bacterium]